jgi:hypothetical protein
MVFNTENLIFVVLGIGILGIGMLVLAGFVIFLLLVKNKSSCNKCPPGGLKKWIEFSKTAKKYISDDDSKKKYNSFCKNATNDNWIKAFGVQGDPHTNGFYDFLIDFSKCPKTVSKKCPPFSALNCPTCAYSNTEWMNINGLNDPDPYTNGYNDFCMTSTGSTLDWFKKVVPILPPLPKGTNGNDPKINGYNKFCGK